MRIARITEILNDVAVQTHNHHGLRSTEQRRAAGLTGFPRRVSSVANFFSTKPHPSPWSAHRRSSSYATLRRTYPWRGKSVFVPLRHTSLAPRQILKMRSRAGPLHWQRRRRINHVRDFFHEMGSEGGFTDNRNFSAGISRRAPSRSFATQYRIVRLPANEAVEIIATRSLIASLETILHSRTSVAVSRNSTKNFDGLIRTTRPRRANENYARYRAPIKGYPLIASFNFVADFLNRRLLTVGYLNLPG